MSIFITQTIPPGDTQDLYLIKGGYYPPAGQLVLDGGLVDPITGQASFISRGYGRQVSVTGGMGIVGPLVTITGVSNGVTQSENIPSPGPGQTVYGTLVYDVVTSVSINKDITPGTSFAVGTGWLSHFSLLNVSRSGKDISYNLSVAQTDTTGLIQANNVLIKASAVNVYNNGYTMMQNKDNNWNMYAVSTTNGVNGTAVQQINFASTVPWVQFLVSIGASPATVGYGAVLNFVQF